MSYTPLPKDPIILISFVNMQLRDHYPSLDDFCSSYPADKESIIETLADYGYVYDPEKNQFLSSVYFH